MVHNEVDLSCHQGMQLLENIMLTLLLIREHLRLSCNNKVVYHAKSVHDIHYPPVVVLLERIEGLWRAAAIGLL